MIEAARAWVRPLEPWCEYDYSSPRFRLWEAMREYELVDAREPKK